MQTFKKSFNKIKASLNTFFYKKNLYNLYEKIYQYI